MSPSANQNPDVKYRAHKKSGVSTFAKVLVGALMLGAAAISILGFLPGGFLSGEVAPENNSKPPASVAPVATSSSTPTPTPTSSSTATHTSVSTATPGIVPVSKPIISTADMEHIVNKDVIYDNIFINGINVGGMTEQQAKDKLAEKYSVADEKVTFTKSEESIVKPLSAFNAKYDIDAAVTRAFSFAREGALEERYSKVKALDNNKYEIESTYSYSDSSVDTVISELAKKYDSPAKEPTFKRENGQFVVGKETYGKVVDRSSLKNQITSLLKDEKGGSIELGFVESKPKYTAADFSKATDMLGTFTTNYDPRSPNRANNIKVASGRIDDTVIFPGQVFSTNEGFLSRTAKNGYKMAGTYAQGKIVEGMGGGVCQVSSTLYMALLFSELNITERTNHSMKVGYMNWACDATLSEGYIDLKFKNDTQYPVTIETVVGKGSVTINIYGHDTHDPGRKLKFENVLISTTQPAAEMYVNDPSLPLGYQLVDTPSKIGNKFELYKLVYKNDVLVDKKLVNVSNYKAIRGIIKVGTGSPDLPKPTGVTPSNPSAGTPAAPTTPILPVAPTAPTVPVAPVAPVVPTEPAPLPIVSPVVTPVVNPTQATVPVTTSKPATTAKPVETEAPVIPQPTKNMGAIIPLADDTPKPIVKP